MVRAEKGIAKAHLYADIHELGYEEIIGINRRR